MLTSGAGGLGSRRGRRPLEVTTLAFDASGSLPQVFLDRFSGSGGAKRQGSLSRTDVVRTVQRIVQPRLATTFQGSAVRRCLP